MRTIYFFVILCLVAYSGTVSAQSTAKATADSSEKESPFDVNLGASNGYFSPRSAGLKTESKLFYTVGAGYYPAQGLTFSVLGMMTNDKGAFTLYQTAVTPGLVFNKGKNWGGGINYTRYFSKDSLSFDLSPLKNEFYGYLTYKPGYLVPELALNYAMGTQKDVLVTQRRTVTRSSSVHDFNALLSVKHEFSLGPVFSDEDAFSFTPSLMTITGTNNYGSNILGSKIPRFTSNKRAAKLAASNTAGAFQLQYVSIYLDFEYTVGKYYFAPQILFDYTVPRHESQWTAIFSLTTGISF
jgi:hypothetical protein